MVLKLLGDVGEELGIPVTLTCPLEGNHGGLHRNHVIQVSLTREGSTPTCTEDVTLS